MPAPPKPERRGPKPPKPIKRSSKPIPRGKRPARVRQTARGRDKKSLQALFSHVIRARDRICQITPHRHDAMLRNYLDACHLLPKGAYPSIEFHTENAVAGCRSCHIWMTAHPTLWLCWVIRRLGTEGYQHLVEFSREVKPETRAEIRARLEAML